MGRGGESFAPETLIPVWQNRFAELPRREIDPRAIPVATGFRARLLGLALLDRADAGPGLLIPRCSAVHTFGMRFALDLHFLDADGAVAAVHRAVPPRRFVGCRDAVAVLEIPVTPERSRDLDRDPARR
jgi:uncharacterized membrane protein (UPF0127 family)